MTASTEASALITQLIDDSTSQWPTLLEELQTRGWQRKVCEELLDLLHSSEDDASLPTGTAFESAASSFLRTTLHTPKQQQQQPSVRELLGVSASTAAQLSDTLGRLITNRVDREDLLSVEATELFDTDDSNAASKAALTISSLSMAAARLYVELLGKKGAWGAGLVDVGGISAVSALMRRWCVECRGREPGADVSDSQQQVEPEKKRSRGTRKSVRINANVTFLEEVDDNESVTSEHVTDQNNVHPDLNTTFFVTEDSLDATNKLTEAQMISAGIALANSLGRIALQGEWNHWAAEAREAYLDGVVVALATTSALAIRDGKKEECERAVESLEMAICVALSKPEETVPSPKVVSRRGSKKKSPKEQEENEHRRKESTIYILRGCMPLLNLKMEVPNGQAGKLAAYERTTALLVRIIHRLSEESRERRVRLSIESAVTPKRGSRKSISFAASTSLSNSMSHTPGKNTSLGTMQPPSLKKSITPRRTRSATAQETVIHPLLSLIMGMLHKLFTSKGLERADARGRVIKVGITCLTVFPSLERGHLLKFIEAMSHSKVSSHRLLAVELIGDILCTNWYWTDAVSKENKMITPNAGETISSSGLLTALEGRLTDKSPTVRMRAAMSLSEVVRKASAAQEDQTMIDDTVEHTPKTNEAAPSEALIKELCTIGTVLVDSLRDRASTDDKATVRKAAVVAWFEMLSLAHREKNQDYVVSGLDISTLCTLCNDSSVATRKAAAEALTKLVQANYDAEEYTAQASALEMAWAHTVLPLVRDVELSCVSKSLEFFTSLVIEPIIEVGSDASEMLEKKNTRCLVAWRILSKISLASQEAGGSRNGTCSLQVALQKVLIKSGSDCNSLAKNMLRAVYHTASLSLGLDRRSSDSFVSHHSAVETDLLSSTIQHIRAGAWSLLDALTGCLMNGVDNKMSTANVSLEQSVQASRIDSSFLALSLKRLRSLLNCPDVPSEKRAGLVIASRDCLKVIAKMASFVPIKDAVDCFADLLHDLKSFRMTIDLISVAVSALVALSIRLCEDSGKDVYRECEQWINKLLTQCQSAMDSSFAVVARQHSSEYEEENLNRILFTVGELCMVGFSSEDVPGKASNHILATEKEPVRGLNVRPSAQLLQSVKLMLPTFMPVLGGEDDELVRTSSTIRAHAFITLGKLCLRDENLAKGSLNILARELHQNATSDPAVQTNALMVMGDLCVRYTNLVDKYLPFMAACLQAGEVISSEVGSDSRLSITFDKPDGYELVKKNSILLLSSLLLQDYIKWRGLFVFRFLAAVADQDDEVSCLARTAIRGPLLEKQPNLLSSSFVESIFVFNSCKAHPIYAAAASNGGAVYAEIDLERGLLEGNECYHKRKEIYQMMLETMTDEQKLKVTTDIVKRILGGAMDARGDLGIVCRLSPQAHAKISRSRVESATHVLQDAFAILSSRYIKVGRWATEEQEDELAEGNNAKADQRNYNKERLLSKISQKHLMEIVIPVLCNLKGVLEGSRSALLKDLMEYLGYIFRSYKREVSEHLANNPTLLQELEYDMRQFEKKQRESILNTEVVAVA